MRNTERRDRENIKGTEKGQEIAKKSQTGTKESLGGFSLFLKQFWCSYKITNYGENITERERAHRPEPILKASEREKEHGRGPDYGPEASERKPGREDGSVCPSPCQKHQKERGRGAVIAPAPDWKHQRGSAAAVVAA